MARSPNMTVWTKLASTLHRVSQFMGNSLHLAQFIHGYPSADIIFIKMRYIDLFSVFVFFYLETNSKSAKIYLLATMKHTWCAFLSISSPIPCKFLYDLSLPVRSQADHTMSLWLTIADMTRAKSMRVMNKALKITYLNYTSV